MDWVTNDPEVAKALQAADDAYYAARDRCWNMVLADKVRAMRAARVTRRDAYATILAKTPAADIADLLLEQLRSKP